jgi:monolysocardiolipin acyltransferase
MSVLVMRFSRFVLSTLNSLSIERLENFESLRERGGRGLLSFSNHVSYFDDPLIVAHFGEKDYGRIRWVAADARNFFGSAPSSWLFTAGKAVPIVRGAGADQPGLDFLMERLRDGEWVHIFPEGTRTRDPRALMAADFRPGIGRLIAEARPIALPFYHHGMHQILPVGARLPRRGKTVRVVFGAPIDCEDLLDRRASTPGPRLWAELTDHAREALSELEAQVHPDAGATLSDAASATRGA